jgi:4-aminobutyrate aminotransferase-like enzyme
MTREHLERLGRKHPGVISEVEGIGAMIAFRIGDGALKSTREFIQRCFEAGLVLYYGGHDPACIRLFLPAGVVTDEEIREAFAIMDRCLG